MADLFGKTQPEEAGIILEKSERPRDPCENFRDEKHEGQRSSVTTSRGIFFMSQYRRHARL
jgi:hypothetical protein